MTLSHHPSRCRSLVRALSITTVLALGATACSGADASSSGTSPSGAAPRAREARAALDAGLKAHASGDLTTAAADYHKTLKYDRSNKFANYNLALIDEAAGNYGLAEQKYRAALKSDAAYEPALFNLAILRSSRDPKEAIGLYEKAVTANPKDAAAWLNLGLLLRAAGQERAGDKDVLRALGLNPDLKDPKAAG